MGVYEIKHKYLQSIQNTYQLQVTLLDKVREQLQARPDETERIRLQYQEKRIEQELSRIEAELQRAEDDAKKWAGLTRKPFDPSIKQNPKEPDTSPNQARRATAFNVAEVGEIKIEPLELNELLSSRTLLSDPISYLHNLQNAISIVGCLELDGLPIGTATLVSKNRVITSWKVVKEYFQAHSSSQNSFESLLDKLNLRTPATSEGLWIRFTRYSESDQKDQIFQVERFLKKPEEDKSDYAFLELAGAATKFEFAPFYTSIPEEGRTLNVLHYSQEHTLKQATLKVKKVQNEKVLYLGILENVSPGCPVFNERWELIGVHLGTKSLSPDAFLAGLKFGEGTLLSALLDYLA